MAAVNSDTRSEYAGSSPLKDFVARLRADTGLLRRILMYGGVAVVAVVAATLWLTGGRYVSTDDDVARFHRMRACVRGRLHEMRIEVADDDPA